MMVLFKTITSVAIMMVIESIDIVRGTHTARDIARVVVMEYGRCIKSGVKPSVDGYTKAINDWLLRSESPAKLP